MADRKLELIISVVNQASAELQKLKSDLQQASGIKVGGSGIAAIGKDADQSSKSISVLGQGIAGLAFAFNQVQQSVQTLAQAGGQAYDLLIGQNERLNQSIISSASTIAATNKVLIDGVAQAPQNAIKLLQGPLRDALIQVQKDSVDIVGITSGQLTDTFQILTSQISNLSNQSKTLGDPIKAAGKLTIDFAAALGTIGLPLSAARQEINSILTGTIDQNSALAKSLGLTNQQVNAYKAQGVLVDKLRERLSPFLEGNKQAAQSISAISSNLQDLLELTTRAAGEQLLAPLVSGLQAVYNFLKDNQESIQKFVTDVITSVLNLGQQVGGILQTIQPVLAAVGQAFVSLGTTGIQATIDTLGSVLNVFGLIVTASKPLLDVLAAVIKGFSDLASSDVGRIAIQVGLLTAAIVTLGPAFAAATVAASAFATSAIGALTGGITTLAAGGIPALLAGLGALPAAFTAAATAALPLAAALAPLAAGVALTLVVKGTQDLKVANESVEELSKGTNLLADESLKYAASLKALAKAEQENGKLTDDQKKRRENLLKLSADTSRAIDQQIQELQSQKGTNESVNNALDVQINLLKTRKSLLSGQSNTTIAPRDLENLGEAYQQLAKKAKDAQTAIDNQGSGDTGRFQKAAQDLVKITQTQREAGQISEQEAERRLSAIASNSKVEVETQTAAQTEITKLKKTQLDNQINDLKAQESQIEANVSKGRITQVEGAQQATALKRKELEAQIADVEAEIEREQKLREAQVADQIKNIEKQIQDTQKARDAAVNSKDTAGVKKADKSLLDLNAQKKAAQESLNVDNQRQTELKTQRKKLNADLEREEAEGERRIQEAKVKEIDRAAAKLAAATKIAESGRLKTIQDLLNAGQITEEEANARKLRSTQTTLQEEFKAAQDNLKKLSALPRLSDPDAEESRQAKIRDARQKTSDLSLRLAENERAVQIAIVDVIKKKIDEQALRFKNSIDAQNQALQQQLTLQNALTQSLDQQSKLLDARVGLQKSLSDLTQSQYSNSIRLLEAQFDAEDRLKGQVKDRAELEKKVREAKNPDDRKAAEEELKDFDKRLKREEQLRNLRIQAKQAEIAAAQQEFALQQQSLQLEILKNKALQEQERIRLNIEAAQARAETAQRVADLAKVAEDAKLGKATQGQIEAARLQVSASQQKEQGIALQQVNQQQLASFTSVLDQQKQQVLAAQQSSKLQGLQTDLATLTGGNASLAQIQSASKSLASGNQAPDALRRQVEQILPQVLGGIPGLQQSFLGQARATGRATLDNGLDQQLQTAQQQLARTPIVVPPQEQLLPQSIQKGADGMKLFTDAITKLNTKLDTLGNQITIPTTIEGVSDPRTAATLAVTGITKALQTATGKR